MRVVAISQERRLEVLELPSPVLEPDQVRIRVRFCGVCGSDLHMRSSPTVPAGVVMGHEFMGVIEELGAEVSGWAVDDRVVVNPLEPCGVCTDCYYRLNGALCRRHQWGDWAGFNLRCFRRDGRRPPVETVSVAHLDIRRAGGLGGALGCRDACRPDSFTGPRDKMRRPRRWTDRYLDGDRPPVSSLRGRVGYRAGIQRRQTACDMGFLVSPSDTDDSAVSQLGGRPTIVFDCSGHPNGLPSAIALAESGGRVVVIGITTTPSSVPSAVLVSKALRIFGSLAYTDSDFASAIDCLESDVVRDGFITTVAELDQAQHWFDDLSSGATRQVKVLLQP